ncbi:MAG: LysM domain-containing protein [Myxococcota bacterium]
MSVRYSAYFAFRRAILGCLLALVGLWGTATAEAQLDVDDGSYDVGEQYDSRGRGALSLEEGRATGQGIRISGTRRYRAIPEIYTVRRGDTLWDITGRYYGTPWEWPRVWSYNPEVTNPHWIYPLDRLRLLPEGTTRASLPTLGVAAPRQPFRSGTVLLRDQGYLDEDALRTSGVIVGSPEEHMLLANYDEVYIEFRNDQEVRPGMEMTIFREIEDEERVEDEQGVLIRIFGAVRIRSFDEDRRVARAEIIETLDPIERGFRIAAVPRRFELVPPVANQIDLVAEVVAALRPLRLTGDYQVVFVNAGEEQGVRQGNRFFVVREGDEWRETLDAGEAAFGATYPNAEELDEYPPEIIAEGRVVNVRPNSCTLIITRAVTEVILGDRVELRRGY